MKTNKQLTPKELTIYVYSEKVEDIIDECQIYGRYKDKLFGVRIQLKIGRDGTLGNSLKKVHSAIRMVFRSLYALKEWGIDCSKQTMTAKVLGERSFPKKNPYKVISVNV